MGEGEVNIEEDSDALRGGARAFLVVFAEGELLAGLKPRGMLNPVEVLVGGDRTVAEEYDGPRGSFDMCVAMM